MVHLESNKFYNIHKKFENLGKGGFVGRRLPFSYVQDFIKETWKLQNNFIMKPYGDRMFSFEFVSQEERERVLELGCLHIASQLFVMIPCQLFVEANLEEIKMIPIWVKV